jgi:lipoic acid synthetase
MADPIRSTRTSRATWRKTIAALQLHYVVITSVDRDDLRDGGARSILSTASSRRAQLSPDTRRSRCWCPTSAAAIDRALDDPAKRHRPT